MSGATSRSSLPFLSRLTARKDIDIRAYLRKPMKYTTFIAPTVVAPILLCITNDYRKACNWTEESVANPMNISKLSGTELMEAQWGLGIFIFLWLGMLETIAEILLAVPALGSFDLWHGAAIVMSAAAFSFISIRCSPAVVSSWANLPKAMRMTAIGFLATMFLIIILMAVA